MIYKKGVGLFLFIFLLTSASAGIGVSPAIYQIDFKPGLKQDFYFNFFGDTEGTLKISAEGDLAKYVVLSTDELPGTGGRVDVSLKLPSETEKAGINNLYIAAEQFSEEKGGFNLKGKIRAVIRVKVPFPGDYAEIDFSTTNVKEGNDISYILQIHNLGKNDIVTNSYIEIYNLDNKKVGTEYLGVNSIETTKSTEYSGSLNTSSYKAGDYKAVAVVEYADNTATEESSFKLGKLFVDLIGTNNGFQKDRINRIEMDVESFWNDPIEHVYIDGQILGSNITFTTPSVTLDSFGKNKLVGFFDTTGIEKNTFKAKLRLHYGNQVNEKIVNLKIKTEINYVLIGIICAIVMFLLIILVLFVWIIRLQTTLNEKLNERAKKGRRK